MGASLGRSCLSRLLAGAWLSVVLALAACGPTATAIPTHPVPSPGPLATAVGPEARPLARDKWSLWSGPTRLRGANIYQRRVYPELDGPDFMGPGPIGPPITQQDFDDLATLGANYVNISHPGLFGEEPPYALDPDVQANLDRLLDMAAQADLYAVITFRTGPGRSEFWAFFGQDTEHDPQGWFDPSYYNNRVWGEPAAQEAWAAMWRYTAQRYKDYPAVAGYDLMCEPNSNDVGSYPLGEALGVWDPDEFYGTYGGTLYDWNRLYPRLVAAIREVDGDTPVLIGGNSYSAVAWLPYLDPVDDERVVYVVHQYEPHNYTHQYWDDLRCAYPGMCDVNWDGEEETFDRAFLEALMDTVAAFKEEHGVPVAANEFGVQRWEPGAAAFMADEMALFEAHHLNYALWVWDPAWPPTHAQQDDFSLLHGPDPQNHEDVDNDLRAAVAARWARNLARPSAGPAGAVLPMVARNVPAAP